jgi:O-antigen ligase
VFPGALERRIQYLVLFCALAMTLVVTPWLSLDPINLPKFLVLGTCGFAAIGNLAPYLKQMIYSEARFLVYSVLLFLLSLLMVFFLSGSGTWSQVYGAYGRNTGLLAYAGLALMLISVVFVLNLSFSKRLIWVLTFTGMANAVYGFIQWSGNDPVYWNNPYDPIVGTLGNPNFVSAHLGISGLASLALILESSRSMISRLILVTNVGLSLFVISQSSSSQGLLVFALGVALIFYFRFLRTLHLVVRFGYWLLVLVGSVVGTVGILSKGPLASLLYQDSVTYRGDYWRAGWKMSLDNPLFGVGLDSYGDWYRYARTEAAALRRGPDVTSNSAHNVFLDISSNGGFLLLATYLLIFGLIFRSAIRVLKKSREFDAVGVGLVSAWFAYVIQSVISINQLGLAIWGWVLGGAIIGYDLYRDLPDAPRLSVKKGGRPEQVPAAVVLTGTLGLVIGFIFSIWPLVQDISFRSALESSDGAKIEAAAKEFPRNNYYYIYSAQILQENKIEEKALDLTRLAIASNPRDFAAWKLLAANPKISESEKAAAIAKMRELDPFNNTLGD